eukprot:COSAG03_NODE_14718_length_454_cov_1.380282_1_plen_27_part_01
MVGRASPLKSFVWDPSAQPAHHRLVLM